MKALKPIDPHIQQKALPGFFFLCIFSSLPYVVEETCFQQAGFSAVEGRYEQARL
jgi:hypothetical protein